MATRARATGGKATTRRGSADPVKRSAPLGPYAEKRDFATTPEPKGRARKPAKGNRFCVQRHNARRLHWDLRLEFDGVLKSWAVTRGPSLVPGEKRLAVHTEDHPLEYIAFEGVIPKGEYGGGTMIVWDQGTWAPLSDARKGYAKGHLDFELQGERLGGRWHLVRMRPRPKEKKEQWLLLKGDDEHARPAGSPEIVEEELTSVLSGRSNADLAESGDTRADHRRREETASRKSARTTPGISLAGLRGARKGILPPFVEPCRAALVEAAPEGEEWLHEIKFDGYRLQARLDGSKIALLTRSGLDWTERFPTIAEGLRALALASALIDGEVVVETSAGISSFSDLQADLKAGRSDRLVYHAFDLLYCDGFDLRGAGLLDRKLVLGQCLDDLPAGGTLRLSEHIVGDGEAMARHACRLGLEGVVSKRIDRPYRSGRGGDWTKAKCSQRQEFVVAGYVPSTMSAKAVGSLVLGVFDAGDLIHVGRVGTGFSQALAQDLQRELEALKRPAPPFARPLAREAALGVRWVEPRLVAEVELRGWTADGLLRHAAFKGLREDKDPREVVRESGPMSAKDRPSRAVPAVRLTHPDRVLWPDIGLTKQGLAEFYSEIADWVLPHVAGRPLALVRCPAGTENACFFQKHAWKGMDTAIRRRSIAGEEVLFIEDLAGLVALVQSGVLEIHPWGASIRHVEKPDRITMDLDPGEDVPWTALVEGAGEVRKRLEAAGLKSFVKTTGGKGLHVVVPLKPKAGWDEVKGFAEALADAMAGDSPDRYVATMSKQARRGRIFVDYLRNGRGATAVAAYSTRARAGATVSTPLGWDELSPSMRPDHFTVENLPTRLRHLGSDPWADLTAVEQALPGSRRRTRKAGG